MIDFNKAIEIASEHFRAEGGSELTKIYEAENAWIVYASKKGQVKYGSMGISIDKVTGDIRVCSHYLQKEEKEIK